jgi:hypothetical protein
LKNCITIKWWGLGTAALPCDGLFILPYSVHFVSNHFSSYELVEV